MRNPTPVTTSSMTPVSGSTWAFTQVSNSPATIHGNNRATTVSPDHTRVKSAAAARKAPATAGTATQCARRSRCRPKKMLMRAPASGMAGISQTAMNTAPI